PRRHARPYQAAGPPRPLGDVGTVVVSGGVFRREPLSNIRVAMSPLLQDFGGGWQPPERAGVTVDTAYVLAAVGLISAEYPQAAASLAVGLVAAQGR
ncbi:MAG: glutamate mutase L, partial [Ornithinimicrobium sp.]